MENFHFSLEMVDNREDQMIGEMVAEYDRQ